MSIIQKNNVHVCGKQDAAQTIIFAHGFGSDQTAFAPLVKAFEEEYKIVLYDNVGGGKADIDAFSPQRYSTLQGYVTDVTDIIKSLELQHIIYVGHSVSGMIGLLTSIQYPQYFDKIVLLGSSPRYLNDPEKGYTGGFDMPALNGLYDAMTTNYYAWASGFSALVVRNPDRPQLAEKFASSLKLIRPDIALSVAKTIFEMDYRNDLSKSTVPSLVIQTADDPAVPEEVGDYMVEHIPLSQLAKVNTKGHFPHMSAPDEVTGAIRSFLKD
jgi:sigma-B regulation protein RsbQ